jgi:hypothetical protein
MRLWLTLAAAVTLSCPLPSMAQEVVGKTPASPRYFGPPGSIDGPPALPASVEPRLDPSGAAVVIPEGAGSTPIEGEALTLPGDSVLEHLPPDHILVAPPQKISAYKNSFFQKLSLDVDYLGNEGDPADLGITEVQAFVQVGLPAPIRQWPMLITPGFNLTMLKGPSITDLPPRLYLAYVDIMWLPQIVKGYTALLSVAPSVFGDFQAHQFRLTGKALMIVDCIPDRLQFVAGVLYLNRQNIRLLPAGGFIWMPADWSRLELIFPKPRLAQRFNIGAGYEDWVYTTAEFGGNTWPIVRANGLHDEVTYVDYRILVGCERKLDGGAGYRVELGYVFGRNVHYGSDSGFHPPDSFMLRGGITF